MQISDKCGNLMGTVVDISEAPYRVSAFLGRGKAAYSYLVTDDERVPVYKKFHDEKVEHYTFSNKVLSKVDAFARIRAAGGLMSDLVSFSDEGVYLAKEYIEGPTAAAL